ncbi:hypothetical protein Pd630_LPD04847 [Rhodococcus opacus PD630]|nr:hypothetical protein Pd630_LPD04847 [Rhodococcus opacus PD630]
MDHIAATRPAGRSTISSRQYTPRTGRRCNLQRPGRHWPERGRVLLHVPARPGRSGEHSDRAASAHRGLRRTPGRSQDAYVTAAERFQIPVTREAGQRTSRAVPVRAVLTRYRPGCPRPLLRPARRRRRSATPALRAAATGRTDPPLPRPRPIAPGPYRAPATPRGGGPSHPPVPPHRTRREPPAPQPRVGQPSHPYPSQTFQFLPHQTTPVTGAVHRSPGPTGSTPPVSYIAELLPGVALRTTGTGEGPQVTRAYTPGTGKFHIARKITPMTSPAHTTVPTTLTRNASSRSDPSFLLIRAITLFLHVPRFRPPRR